MLEVPGITAGALEAMRPRAVAALRWGLYARALEPIVSNDLDAAATSIEDAATPPSKAVLAVRRARMREVVAQARKGQAAARELLLLDDESDED